jgi:hypothetical protein
MTGQVACSPNSHFKSFCNTCGCSNDGMSYICTKMMCDEKIWNQDGSLKIIPQIHKVVKLGKTSFRNIVSFCFPYKEYKYNKYIINL